jgi:hypothetical protein
MSTDLKTELEAIIQQHSDLESEIFKGDYKEIHVNDEIAKLCEDFDNDYYETGKVKKNYRLDLNQLIAKAKPSNFGLGTKTKYDPNVRNSVEVMASDLDPEFVSKIQENIKLKKLATHYELRPYKLAIYKEGAFFKQHKDTIRDPKHIGTVSCILDSYFSGGSFVMEHSDKTDTIYSGQNTWVAIYGDVFHEVEKVTYGTRVSMLFDIYLKEGNDTIEQLRSKINSTQAESLLQLVGSKFSKQCNTVVIGMFHEYSKAQLDAKDLKNTDKCIYEILKQHFKVDLQVLKYYESVYGDDTNEKHILDFTGNLSKAYISFNDYIHEEGTGSIFTRGQPYTGNDGGDSENLYLWGGFVITRSGDEEKEEQSDPEPESEPRSKESEESEEHESDGDDYE